MGPVARASDSIARFDSFLGLIPNPDLLIAPLMKQEAVASSRIEGTRASVSDVLIFEAGGDSPSDKADDIMEVLNYQRAVVVAERMLNDLPFSGRVLKEAHKILLDGVRGQTKSPGRYRTEQNWIGTSYDIAEARYVPVSPLDLDDAMAAWERYVNDSGDPALVKIAVAHAEFESIHPFCDGNGRIGRMMIPLMLNADGLLSNPCFYLSEFFEHRNSEYQDRLLAVSRDGDWTGWCEFFINAVAVQAVENAEKARRIFDLYKATRSLLIEKSNSINVDKIMDPLFQSAIFSARAFSGIPGVSNKTTSRMLAALKELGVVKEIFPHSGQRPSIYAFGELLKITDGIEL